MKKSRKFVPLIISAAPTAGKSVLAALLEGHPEIFSLPIFHDNIAAALLEFRNVLSSDYPKISHRLIGNDRQLEAIRRVLATKTQWPSLEGISLQKFFIFVLSGNIYLKVPVDFDFYDLEKNIGENIWRIKENKELNPWSIFDVIFDACYSSISCSYKKPHYAVSMNYNEVSEYEDILECYPEAKIVYIDRDITDALAIFLYRDARLANIEFCKYIKQWEINNRNFIVSQLRRLNHIVSLESKFPDRIKKLSFVDIIKNTKATMKSLSDWLEVGYDSILEKPTFIRNCIDERIIGEIQDDPQNLLTQCEKQELYAMLSKYKEIYGIGTLKNMDEIYFPASIFSTDLGRDENNNIIISTSDAKGNIFYGPYMQIPPGKYNVSYIFSDFSKNIYLNCNHVIHLDCIDGQEKRYFDKDCSFDELVNNPHFILDVHPGGGYNFEFRAFALENSSNGKIYFNGIRLLKIDEQIS